MSRRTRDTEVAIGSDSFLDVMANIVGILIVLIVIVGLRVSQGPIALTTTADDGPVPLDLALPRPAAAPVAPPTIVVAPPSPVVVRDPIEAPQPIALSPELLRRARALEAKLRQTQTTATALAANWQQVARQQQEIDQRSQQTAQSLESTGLALEVSRTEISRNTESLSHAQADCINLQWRLQHAKRAQTTVKTVEHRLTPVSRTVEGHEVHFELRAGRVAYVPLEDLLSRLKTQIQRQQDWLIKFGRHEGQVGPVKGYIMRYVVERQQMSVIDELRHGNGLVRISISQWQIAQSDTAVTETLEEAVREGSAFQQALLGTDVGATLTFWVYPDSFDLYRGLQQAAHAEGYTVAARPLPFGVPIAGSPQGSRSAGQ